MFFLNAFVLDKISCTLADLRKIGVFNGGSHPFFPVLLFQNSDKEMNNRGLGVQSSGIDTTSQDDVMLRDSWDAWLINTSQSKMDFPGSTNVGNKVLRGGIRDHHLGRIAKGQCRRHSPAGVQAG